MKRLLYILLIALVISACGQQREKKDCTTYTEPTDPSPDLAADWSTVKPGLHAAIGSIDKLYMKSSIPETEIKTDWIGSAWRGEIVSAQIVLWSKEAVDQVECEFTDFKSKDGKSLSSSIAEARFVRYVMTDEFAGGCGYRKQIGRAHV